MKGRRVYEPKIETRVNVKDGETRGALYLYDVIGWPYLEARDVVERIEQLRAAGATALDIFINSPGGDVYDSMAIYAAVSRFPGEKVVTIDGLCASGASAIAMAGDRVIAHAGGMLMIHNPWTIVMGESRDLRKRADWLDAIQGVLAGIYSKASGLDLETIRSMMDAETWMTAQEAYEKGFVDELASIPEATASVEGPEDRLTMADRFPPLARQRYDEMLAELRSACFTIRNEETDMNEHLQKIAAQLGLAADASPDDILSAVTSAVERTATLASIHNLLGLPADAESKLAVLAVLDLQRPDNAVPREQHAQVVAELGAARVELSVMRAVQAGVISATEADKDHWRKRARVDLEDCDRLIASGANRVVPMDEQRPRDQKTARTDASGLTEHQAKICAELGITAEQFKAARLPHTFQPDRDEN